VVGVGTVVLVGSGEGNCVFVTVGSTVFVCRDGLSVFVGMGVEVGEAHPKRTRGRIMVKVKSILLSI
jgi:hypothetical protein